jgi:hypothetical protein
MLDRPISVLPRNYARTDFRSSLEADWAATLDGLDLQWRYQPQVFELPGGERYLPHFWLPQIGTWIEVRGPGTAHTEKALEFAEMLACRCPPAACVCAWEGGPLVLVGHPPHRPRDSHLRHGSLRWSAPLGSAYLTRCHRCLHQFWVQPRVSWRCRHCRAREPRNAHLRHLHNSYELEFRRADRLRDSA